MTNPIEAWRNPPAVLYKYYSVNEHSLSLLRNDEVFFSNPLLHFNDPFDTRLPFDMSGTLVEWERKYRAFFRESRVKKTKKELRAAALTALKRSKEERFVRQTAESTLHNVGAFCLSEVCDHLLMFAHYGDHHRGFCVGFAVDKLRYAHFYFGLNDRFTAPIEYADSYSPPSYLRSSELEKVAWSLHTKSNVWRYEREWRVTDQTGYGVRKIPHDMLVEIYLGCQMSEKDRTVVLDALTARRFKPRIYQFSKALNSFELERQSVAIAV